MTLSEFYKSKLWQVLTQRLRLERVDANGDLLCAHCGNPIVKAYDCIGHHKVELTEFNVNDVAIALNPDNVDMVHHKCHNIIHERFGYDGTRHVYIVYGPPNSGKTTYVHNVANASTDLILDLDSLWQAITVSPRYVKPKRMTSNVFALRDAILDQVNVGLGAWRTAWIIGGYPLASEREHLANKLGAELIYIECDMETCLNRCTETAKGYGYDKYIYQWFERYTE